MIWGVKLHYTGRLFTKQVKIVIHIFFSCPDLPLLLKTLHRLIIGVIMSEYSFRKGENMTYLVWLLRIIHIVGGVFWVGGTLIMTFFIGPTVGATAEAGQRFIGHLMNNLKFSNRMSAAAGLTVLAGLILFGLDARAGSAWVRSGMGVGLSIGAAFALVGLITGIMIGRSAKAMADLGSKIQGKPSAEQVAQLQNIGKQQATISRISATCLIIAVTFMAVARYLGLPR
jgi:uncharacterized membrane protein